MNIFIVFSLILQMFLVTFGLILSKKFIIEQKEQFLKNKKLNKEEKLKC